MTRVPAPFRNFITRLARKWCLQNATHTNQVYGTNMMIWLHYLES